MYTQVDPPVRGVVLRNMDVAEDGNIPVAFALLEAGQVVAPEFGVEFELVGLLRMAAVLESVVNRRVRLVCS